MASCQHLETEFIGEEKTDMGFNTYRKCKACSAVLVITPDKKVFAIDSVKHAQ